MKSFLMHNDKEGWNEFKCQYMHSPTSLFCDKESKCFNHLGELYVPCWEREMGHHNKCLHRVAKQMH